MPAQTPEEQLAFVMACLKHTGVKPDFEAVASDLGIAATTCYHRHWRMMKDFGVGNSAPSTPTTGKRGRPKGTGGSAKGSRKAINSDNNAEEDDASPSKKVKADKVKTEEAAKVKKEVKDGTTVEAESSDTIEIDSEVEA